MKSNASLTLILATAIFALTATPGLATEYTVNVLGDEILGSCDGMHCTLREAIIDANNHPGTDIINLPAGETLLVVNGGGLGTGEDFAATGDLDIRDSVSILGAGTEESIVDANRMDRVFHIPVPGISVTFSQMTIRGGGGMFQSGHGGGGIWSQGSTVNVLSSKVVNNRTGTLVGSTYAGGGIHVNDPGNLNLWWSTVSGNRAEYNGGIDFRSSGDLSIIGSTISNNLAVVNNGALTTSSDSASITNSTIAFNSTVEQTGTRIGGIYNLGHLDITASTIYGNTGEEIFGIHDNGELVTLTNSIVRGRCTGGEASFASGGGNVYKNRNDCELGPTDTNLWDLALAPFGDYGGPTRTLVPLPDSLLIDRPDADAGCTSLDQRNVARPQDGDDDGLDHCDPGAAEHIFDEVLWGDDLEMQSTVLWSQTVGG